MTMEVTWIWMMVPLEHLKRDSRWRIFRYTFSTQSSMIDGMDTTVYTFSTQSSTIGGVDITYLHIFNTRQDNRWNGYNMSTHSLHIPYTMHHLYTFLTRLRASRVLQCPDTH